MQRLECFLSIFLLPCSHYQDLVDVGKNITSEATLILKAHQSWVLTRLAKCTQNRTQHMYLPYRSMLR